MTSSLLPPLIFHYYIEVSGKILKLLITFRQRPNAGYGVHILYKLCSALARLM